MSFDENRFPIKIAMGSTGGPRRQTQIVIKGSGSENRNARWANSRREYDVGYGLHSMNDLWTVLAYFEAHNAQLIGFRFLDWTDWKSCPPDNAITPTDQNLGTGDPTVSTYQLIKHYTVGAFSYTRTILKPVAGTVRIALNGVEQMSGFTVDTTTGLVNFTSAPGGGVVVTAGYEFDVPVRFNADNISINMQEAEAGKFPNIPLLELFDGT